MKRKRRIIPSYKKAEEENKRKRNDIMVDIVSHGDKYKRIIKSLKGG